MAIPQNPLRASLRLQRDWFVSISPHDAALTRALLAALRLPGEVGDGTLPAGQWDTIRRTHALATGLASGYLYWIVNKASVAPWTLAPLHPRPASATIALPPGVPAATS